MKIDTRTNSDSLIYSRYPFFIHINLEDNALYTEVALLVDKPQFVKMVVIARRELSKRFSIKWSLKSAVPNLQEKQRIDQLLSDDHLFQQDVEAIINHIRWNFSKPFYFTESIKQALLFGVVSEGSIQRTPITTISSNNALHPQDLMDLPVVTQQTTWKEWGALFHKLKKELIKTENKQVESAKERPTLNYSPDAGANISHDIKSDIRRIRYWYQMRCERMSPSQIARQISLILDDRPLIPGSIEYTDMKNISQQTNNYLRTLLSD